MFDRNAMKEEFSPLKKMYNYVQYKIEFRREHPNYFYPDGLFCFVGPQGSGKTLSAVNYVCNLMEKYPMCKLVTNIMLADYPIVTFEEFVAKTVENYNPRMDYRKTYVYSDYLEKNRIFPFDNNDDFSRYNNGEYGVIFFIDEIQLYLNSLESKNINMDVMNQMSQQRKQRKHIVCTSQVFSRLAKPLREQFSSVVLCRNYFGFIQKNQVVNRDSIDDKKSDDSHLEGEVMLTSWFVHSPLYYHRYDTYYIIDRNKFISEERKAVNIYDNRLPSDC